MRARLQELGDGPERDELCWTPWGETHWAEWNRMVESARTILSASLLEEFLSGDCVLVPRSKLRPEAIEQIISADRHYDDQDRTASAAEEVIMYLTEPNTTLASKASAEQSLTEPPW